MEITGNYRQWKLPVITGNYRGVARAITKVPLRPRRGPASGPEGRGLRGVRRGSVVPDGRRPHRLRGRSGTGRGLRGPTGTLARAKVELASYIAFERHWGIH